MGGSGAIRPRLNGADGAFSRRTCTLEAVSAASLEIKLFGGLELRGSDGAPLALPSRVARSLLAYILTHRDRSHPRERLIAVFWPELPEQTARRRLSQALWRIQQVLGDGLLETDPLAVRLNPRAPIRLDLETFEATFGGDPSGVIPTGLSSERLSEAIQSFRGEFLDGLDDDWVLEAREAFRERYLVGLERLARDAEAFGGFERALELARRVVSLEPMREQAHREVMRLCLILSRPREALEQYERCRRVMLEEFGEQPDAQTRGLYQRIQIGESSAQPGTSPLEVGASLPLVGRERERGMLLEHLELARTGRGGVVMLEGEPGLGKTRLLSELAQDAVWRGLEVRWSQGQEWIALEPYALVRQAVESGLTPIRAELIAQHLERTWLYEAARVIPAFAAFQNASLPRVPLESEQDGTRLREALVQTLLSHALAAPQVVIFDDLQWTDEASAELLVALARQLLTEPVLVVLSYRLDEARERPAVWNALQAIDSGFCRARIALEPLSSAETGQLVRRALGSASETPFAQRLGAEAQGNPLLVLETLRAVLEHGGLEDDRTELPLPATVREVIVARLARLSPPARAVLDAAAVIGSNPVVELCIAASRSSPSETLSLLDQLVRRGYLAESPTGLRFTHDRLRQIVYGELIETERRAFHRAVGEALECRSDQAFELLARHFDQAGVWDRALEYHRRSAERASSLHDYQGALVHLDRALNLAETLGLDLEEHYALLERRVEALSVLNRRPEHAADLERMERLAEGNPVRLGRVRCGQARLLVATGQFQQGSDLARMVLEDAHARVDHLQEADALRVLATVATRTGRRIDALPLNRQIVELYRLAEHLPRLASAHRSLAQTLMLLQHLDEAHREIVVALGLHRKLKDRIGIASDVGVLGHIWRFRGQLERAAACYRFDLQTSRSIKNRSGEGSSLINLAQVSARLHLLGQAVSCYAQAVEVLAAINDPEGEASARYNLAGLQAGWLGDHHGALENLVAARHFFEHVADTNGLAYCLLIESEMALDRDESNRASELLNDDILVSGTLKNRWLGGQYDTTLAELEIRQGHPERALSRIERAEERCRSLKLDALLAGLVAARAEALLALDQPEAAFRAIADLEDADFKLEFVRHRALVALGRDADSRAALDRAHASLMRALNDLAPEDRRRSLQRVPIHRAIVGVWENAHLKRIVSRLPRLGAPTGRGLRDDEYVEVTWTLFSPEDNTALDKALRRQSQLARLLREASDQGAAPTVEDLARALEASPATLKRDLAALRQSSGQVRTRGTRTPETVQSIERPEPLEIPVSR